MELLIWCLIRSSDLWRIKNNYFVQQFLREEWKQFFYFRVIFAENIVNFNLRQATTIFLALICELFEAEKQSRIELEILVEEKFHKIKYRNFCSDYKHVRVKLSQLRDIDKVTQRNRQSAASRKISISAQPRNKYTKQSRYWLRNHEGLRNHHITIIDYDGSIR